MCGLLLFQSARTDKRCPSCRGRVKVQIRSFGTMLQRQILEEGFGGGPRRRSPVRWVGADEGLSFMIARCAALFSQPRA
jgi:hypothetical protein